MTMRLATAAGAGPDIRFFVPFMKVEEQADGSVYVEGVATAEVLDLHGEVVSYEASKRAFENWSGWAQKVSGGASLGNIRVMHQPVVAGKAVKWWADDATRSIHLGSLIEDPTAAKLCKSRAYTGYSIGGGNVTRQMQPWEGKSVPWVTEYDLSENSIVDKGACPPAIFTLVKSADHKEFRMTLNELFKANRLAVLAVAAKMTDPKTIKLGDQVISLDALEKDAAGTGASAMTALKAFMGEVLNMSADVDLWSLSDILESMRYCYSACLGVQYAMADATVEAAAGATDLKKAGTPPVAIVTELKVGTQVFKVVTQTGEGADLVKRIGAETIEIDHSLSLIPFDDIAKMLTGGEAEIKEGRLTKVMKSETPADPDAPAADKPAEATETPVEEAKPKDGDPAPPAPAEVVPPADESESIENVVKAKLEIVSEKSDALFGIVQALATSIAPLVKAFTEGTLTKGAGTEIKAETIEQLQKDVAAIKSAIEKLPAPPAGRAVHKTLGEGSGAGDVNVQGLVKIAEDALAKAADQGTPKSALDAMRLAFTTEVMKLL